MGGSGGPHGDGKVIGMATCVSKTPRNNNVVVKFDTTAAGNSSASWIVSAEDAEYFAVGQTYSVSFTKP